MKARKKTRYRFELCKSHLDECECAKHYVHIKKCATFLFLFCQLHRIKVNKPGLTLDLPSFACEQVEAKRFRAHNMRRNEHISFFFFCGRDTSSI